MRLTESQALEPACQNSQVSSSEFRVKRTQLLEKVSGTLSSGFRVRWNSIFKPGSARAGEA